MLRTGYIHGTGNALNIELGWIPDRVEVYNATVGGILEVFPRVNYESLF